MGPVLNLSENLQMPNRPPQKLLMPLMFLPLNIMKILMVATLAVQ